ncbi:hypothetical protein HZC31_01805 [Candidatus Woesearchaeota archaeon]|nr:hypothetical protein [Candidatus Woesearchaeota archaeon]
MTELNYGRNFNLDKENQDDYKKIQKTDFFKGKDLKDIFIFSMALGFKYGMRQKVPKKYPLINASVSRKETWLIASIAVKEEGVKILKDTAKMRNIAEEFAHAGFQILKKRFLEQAEENPVKRIEKELLDLVK